MHIWKENRFYGFEVQYPTWCLFCCSVAQSYMTLRPQGLQHARLPCPSPSPWACSNSCSLSRWCHPTISSLVIPFSSCLQSFPASASCLMSWFLASGGQSIGASALASVHPMNIQGWYPLGLAGLISLQSKGLPRVFSKNQSCSNFLFLTNCFVFFFHLLWEMLNFLTVIVNWSISPSSSDKFYFWCSVIKYYKEILYISVKMKLSLLPNIPFYTP